MRVHGLELTAECEVETSLPDDLPRVLGDEAALAEAFAHLVANAAEALTDQPKARITLSAKPVRDSGRTSGVIVTIRDNGHGISPELKEKIFSPFCTTKPRGMGLGLPIVKRTIFDHNGRVEIDSSPQGHAGRRLVAGNLGRPLKFRISDFHFRRYIRLLAAFSAIPTFSGV